MRVGPPLTMLKKILSKISEASRQVLSYLKLGYHQVAIIMWPMGNIIKYGVLNNKNTISLKKGQFAVVVKALA